MFYENETCLSKINYADSVDGCFRNGRNRVVFSSGNQIASYSDVTKRQIINVGSRHRDNETYSGSHVVIRNTDSHRNRDDFQGNQRKCPIADKVSYDTFHNCSDGSQSGLRKQSQELMHRKNDSPYTCRSENADIIRSHDVDHSIAHLNNIVKRRSPNDSTQRHSDEEFSEGTFSSQDYKRQKINFNSKEEIVSLSEPSETSVIPSCLLGQAPSIIFKTSNSVKIASDRETDDHKIQMRMKQISYGKNTVGYDNYVQQISKRARRGYLEHPRTPDPFEKQSKRTFDGRIRVWRRLLHKWDASASATSTAPVTSDQSTAGLQTDGSSACKSAGDIVGSDSKQIDGSSVDAGYKSPSREPSDQDEDEEDGTRGDEEESEDSDVL